MSWEFRKVKPGENVAVEAQRDPFAGPKWAPPVWHMPEGLILLAGLLRLLARPAVFCLRHPIAVGAAAGAGRLGVRFGRHVPALVAVPVAVYLISWAFADRPSFVRWIVCPARSRWRAWWIYRRHWQPVLLTAGLTKTHKGREYLPTLRRVVCGPTSDRVLVQMLKGQAPEAWERAAAKETGSSLRWPSGHR